MLCMDDTLHEENVLMILDELNYKTVVRKSRSRKDDFSSKLRCRRAADNSFLPALHVKDNYACGLRQRKQTRTRLRSRILNSPIHRVRTYVGTALDKMAKRRTLARMRKTGRVGSLFLF